MENERNVESEKTVMVSVCCLVYNHEPYLRECFDGFVMQKTNFPIEILVHDDASTDHSADIIREYTAKYPHLFKPIYQTENQYSKGVPITAKYQFSRAKGKYIAMCEGDDYWTDPLKLQKQVDFMEQNLDFSVCYHSSYERKEDVIISPPQENETIEYSDIYTLAHGNVIYTASVLYRSNQQVFSDILTFGRLPATDYVCHLLFAQYGKIAKLPQTMSVYRRGVGIWSQLSYPTMVYHDTILLIALMDYFKPNNDVYDILKKQLQSKIESLYTRGVCKLTRENNELKLSKSYRIGYSLLHPIQMIKNLF